MTHLVIENQNSNTEIVSAAIILKLYEMALSAEGDVSLKGNLLSDHAKLIAHDYLTGNLPNTSTKRFPNLSLNITSGLYIDFADPQVERVLKAHNVGDGVGIVLSDLSNVTDIGTWFLGNTDIVSFNELRYTNVRTILSAAFSGCTLLLSIDLSNVTKISSWAFSSTSNLANITSLLFVTRLDAYAFRYSGIGGVIDIPNVTSIDNNALSHTNITKIITGSALTSIGIEACSYNDLLLEIDLSASTNLTTIETSAFSNTIATKVFLPSSITSIKDWAIVPKDANVASNRSYYIYATTPPTVAAARSLTTSLGATLNAIYVPSGSVLAYKDAPIWSTFASVILAMPTT